MHQSRLLSSPFCLMKILWVKSDFLHPTNRGGQIRTLEMLKCLHRRHEVHYVALDEGTNPEGLARAGEYSSFAYPVAHRVPPRRSLHFAGQLVKGLVSPMPVSVFRYASGAMRRQVELLLSEQKFDSLVCDFLFPTPNIPDLKCCVLFQHNVESIIWQRHVEQARNPVKKAYFGQQARRMKAYEGEVCRRTGAVITVSAKDSETIRHLWGVACAGDVKTGVDLDYFAPPVETSETKADLVFVGSMDWLPNIDGVEYFTEEILPLIRSKRPGCRVAIAGRRPTPGLQEIARRDPGIVLTGTVPDIRPWLWGSLVSIVPLRIGGGTRLKIFEAMAAGLPVVSTAVGAEGLPLEDGHHIAIADDPVTFANRCVELLESRELRCDRARVSLSYIAEHFSWDAASRDFEAMLAAGPKAN